MTELLKFSKKLFSVSVVMMTILWSMGLAALMPAGAAMAATMVDPEDVEVGDLVKRVDLPNVYYIDEAMQRNGVASGAFAATWYANYNKIGRAHV